MKTIRIIKTSKVLSLFIILSVIAAMAGGAELLYEASGTASFKLFKDANGIRSTLTTSQNYDLYRDYTEVDGEQLYLVSSHKSVQTYLDAEGLTGTISWTVRKGAQLQNVLWGKTETATELNVHGNKPVLVTGLGGCCAAMTGYRLYDIENGRLLMSFNDFSFREKVTQPFSLEVPNSSLKTRWVGVLSGDSTRDRDFETPQTGKTATLLVKYASNVLKQKLQIDMEVEKGWAPSVLEVKMEKDPSIANSDKIEIHDEQVTLWNIDGSTNPAEISGVILKITLNGGKGDKIVKIPVKGDQLDVDHAVVPAGVDLYPIMLLRGY
ncbi:hypothetical protein QJS83_11565 [Bdellovibrio sp. 22V]|uniref:hypothetical protein n=1 Tax=Bdellovibrio TaxID=958 RepID=UPI002542CFEB|nr:hypothetical protein [Bdellovibrio sp. 22V]WII71099.1 hypothetical protein QJS83_11565 [Bdellovibrio sp. 22V]